MDGSNGANSEIAKAHGFHGVALLNTYADYPGEQRENITRWMPNNYSDPWTKPPFFEQTIKRNISNLKPDDIYVNDIEVNFQGDPNKARAEIKSNNLEMYKNPGSFQDVYFKEMAQWFSLPLIWTKQKYPKTKVGLYGVQPFRRDYWGIVGKSILEIDGAHEYDINLWKHIDPYVDFYTSSVYYFYDTPDSYYYLMANIENNYLSTRKYGNKPVYAYEWLRYHTGNSLLANQEVRPELVEAMAILPFFSGAQGIALYGWEPQIKQAGEHPYANLKLFVKSLKRLEPLSSIITDGSLIIDKNASQLWNTKEPIIRKIEKSKNECLIMAVNPWQVEAASPPVKAVCGENEVSVKMQANHITLISIKNGVIKYH